MSHLAASNESTLPTSRWPVWIGRTLSGLVILFLVMDAGMKIAALPVVTESAVMIGYAWPRTAVLGAILLTGFLGGAVATHLRMSDPLFSHTLFGVYLGVALWGGLWLRDARVRNLLPIG
jgi:hypothetical protein